MVVSIDGMPPLMTHVAELIIIPCSSSCAFDCGGKGHQTYLSKHDTSTLDLYSDGC